MFWEIGYGVDQPSYFLFIPCQDSLTVSGCGMAGLSDDTIGLVVVDNPVGVSAVPEVPRYPCIDVPKLHPSIPVANAPPATRMLQERYSLCILMN